MQCLLKISNPFPRPLQPRRWCAPQQQPGSKRESQPSQPKKPGNGKPGNGKGGYNVQQPMWNKKGGKKGAKGKQRVPPTIYKMGGTATDADGRPICFAYNSEAGCSESVAEGARCNRGFHICAKCFRVHPITQHASAS